MPAHYKPCANCTKAEATTNNSMFYCTAIDRQIPNEEFINKCEHFNARKNLKMYL